MKYCVLLLLLVALNAKMSITSVQDQEPRPTQIKPEIQSPLILEETIKKTPQEKPSNQHSIQTQSENTETFINSQQVAQNSDPISEIHRTELIGNHDQPIFPINLPYIPSPPNSGLNPFFPSDSAPKHHGHQKKNHKNRDPQFRPEHPQGHPNSQGPNVNSGYGYDFEIDLSNSDDEILEIFFIIMIPVLIIIAFTVGIASLIVACRQRKQHIRRRRALQYHQNQPQVNPNFQRINAERKYHEGEVLRLREVLQRLQQRQAAQQNYNNAYGNFNYYPAPVQPQMMRPNYISVNDDSQIPVGRPVRQGEFEYPRI